MISTILLVFALVLFCIAGAINQPPDHYWRGRLLCFGLACWVGSALLSGVKLLG